MLIDAYCQLIQIVTWEELPMHPQCVLSMPLPLFLHAKKDVLANQEDMFMQKRGYNLIMSVRAALWVAPFLEFMCC